MRPLPAGARLEQRIEGDVLTTGERTDTGGLAALLIASDQRLRKRLLRALSRRGHQAISCARSDELPALCAAGRVQLAVIAWSPDADAASEACRVIRLTPGAGDAMILAILDGRESSQLEAALAAGADDFVRLPAREDVLEFRLAIAERRIAALCAHRLAQAALRESEERYALSARGANDGLWDWDLLTNKVYFSGRWREMLGGGEDEPGDDPEIWFGRIHSEDQARVREALQAHLDGVLPWFRTEHRIRHQDGAYRWVLTRGLAVRGEDGRPHRIAGSQTDITDRKLVEQQLLHGAFHDSLTGLPNRALFSDRLAQALARGRRREGFQLAVIFLDVDRFKVINDGLGHHVGDQLLVALGKRLEALLRETDTVARLGGDEFALLLEELDEPRQASLVAERIRNDLGQPFDLGGQEVFATVSSGIALSQGGAEQAEELLRDADTAMYRAKASGRNCYAIFDPQMHARAVAALQLENDLRHAVTREEFCAYFQPIISLSSGRITGFEALARWHHPRRGLLLPADFIPTAEETGLIVPIDRLVLNAACRQARSWGVRFRKWLPLTMSVNISGSQFTQPDLVMQVDHALRSSGLWGQALKLEITETAIMENAALAVAMFEQLRTLAVTFSIDDFGTGYSSLSNLRRFEIDTLKIDTSFVARMLEDEETAEIVGALVNLAFNLHKDLVAEGVESPQQLAHLRQLGCSHAQGYLFSPPLEAEAATELLTSNPRW
ncbi:MAG: EAL domain-containing protein [Acidobacteriota bacterium]